jgi:hypothetical protein
VPKGRLADPPHRQDRHRPDDGAAPGDGVQRGIAAVADRKHHRSATASAGAWAADVEAMLQRFEKNGRTKNWPHRKIAGALKALGYTPATPATGDRPTSTGTSTAASGR